MEEPQTREAMSEIQRYLADRQEAMTEALRQLVTLESPTHEPAAVNGVADWLANAFGAMGAEVERVQADGFGDHLRVTWDERASGALPGDRPRRQVLLLGHMDTVWPLGETARRPFAVSTGDARGALIGTGPGAFDMKGGLVVGLYALEALRAIGAGRGAPVPRLVFLFNSDEEMGSRTSRPLIEAEARRSDCVLVLEPSREEALVVWRKGVGRFEVKVHGVASHSGAAHERGVSAVEELAHQVLRLEAMTDYGRGTTVNVGVVQGGSVVNARPARARASVDLRVMTAGEGRRMETAILGLQAVNPRATVSVSGGMNRPPWEPNAGSDDLFERARRAGAELGMELWPAGAGGGSDGNFTAALGVPTLDGLGVVGEDAHAVSEWVDLGSLPRRAALLAGLLLELGR